jgi:hypothetical protein
MKAYLDKFYIKYDKKDKKPHIIVLYNALQKWQSKKQKKNDASI